MKEIVRFTFQQDEDENFDIFVKMEMPEIDDIIGTKPYNNRVAEIDDAIFSYLNSQYCDDSAITDSDILTRFEGYEKTALTVAQRFDPEAEIVHLTTFVI